MPSIFRFARMFVLVAVALAGIGLAHVVPADAAIQPGPGKGWLTIASRTNANDAIALANQYAGRFPSVVVFQSSNGYFGVSLGWANIGEAQPLLQSLISSGAVPADSYFTAGARFVRAIWSASNAHTLSLPDLLAATYLHGGGAVTQQQVPRTVAPAGQPGYVTGLDPNGDNYLSLRTGPGTGNREIARMRPDTQVTITSTSGRWLQVSLANGMNGWAYGKYIASGYPPGVASNNVPTVGPATRNTNPIEAFRVTDFSAETDADTPQICVQFSEGLASSGVDYSSFVTVDGPVSGVINTKGNQICATGLIANNRYRITLAAGLPSATGKTLDKPVEIGAFVRGEPSTAAGTGGSNASNEQKQVASTPPAVEPQKPVAIADQKRVALVIGNSAYQNAPELPNPHNDAAAMSAKLSTLGFKVITSLDGTKVAMENAVRDFVREMTDADVVLLFYAGHGMQVNGVNYLIPIDAKLEDSTALDFETIDLNTILNFMNQDDRISIALLDACRDNPLSRRFTRSLGATRSAFIGRGLAAPTAGTGQVLIGFATAPGEVAQDGAGNNSPFTTALLDNIATKGLEIELMLKRVKQEVYESTNKEQEPWNNSALRKEFYFNPG